MIVGILIGDLIYLVFALFGLAAIATYFGPIFIVVRWAGALYLLYIAWQFWTARPGSEQLGPRKKEPWIRTFLAGFALTMGNPKTIVFYLALLPTVVRLEDLTVAGFLEIVAVISIGLPLVLGGYVLLAARARTIFRSERAVRRMNRGTGAAMACAAVAVATR